MAWEERKGWSPPRGDPVSPSSSDGEWQRMGPLPYVSLQRRLSSPQRKTPEETQRQQEERQVGIFEFLIHRPTRENFDSVTKVNDVTKRELILIEYFHSFHLLTNRLVL